MTTSTITTPIDGSTTAGLRAWGSEFSAQLAAVGLVQTADTGQINWATAVLSGVGNTSSGYEIWRFVDSTIYMKFEYGTGAGAGAYVGMWLTVGTGSNGSGTLTGSGVVTARTQIVSYPPVSTTTSYASYFSRTAGHFAFFWKSLAIGGNQPLGYAIIGKTVDGTGATTTTGYGVIWPPAGASVPQMVPVRLIATASVGLSTIKFCTAIGEPVTSVDAVGNYQIYEAYVNVPDVQPFLYGCGVNTNDIPRGATFSVAMVGATAHTYLGMGNTFGLNNHSTANYGLAMLYE